MRLLLLTNLYPPQNLGGFGLCLQRLCKGLEALGYKPLVLTSDAPYLGPAGLDPRICRSLQLLGSYEGGISRLGDSGEEQRRQQHNQSLLNKILNIFKPQACLVGNLDLLGLELLDTVLAYGIPTQQHVGFMGAPMPLHQYPRGKGAYGMAFASGEVKRLLQKQGFPVAQQPVVYPPLRQNKPPQASQPKNGALRVGYCGLLMQSKGVHVLLEAVARLQAMGSSQALSIQLAGKAFAPNYENELRDYCERVGITPLVEWRGFLEEEALQNFYAELDVLVFPSLHPESFGMVVAEAMVTGVVPISSGVGGAYEVITHGRNGLLVPPGDSNALAEALNWCRAQPQQRQTIAKRARKDALCRYTPQQSALALHQGFQRLR